jgi:hypothetical protein
MSRWIREASLLVLTQATVACWGATTSGPNGAHGPRGSGASAGQGAAIGVAGGTGGHVIAGGANAVDTGGAGSSGVGPSGGTSALGGKSAGGTPTLIGGAAPTSGGNGGRCPGDPPTKALIDDMESGTGRILDNEGRLGVWYTFNDQTDSPGNASGTQWPARTTPGVPIPTSVIDGGRGCSTRAMHSYGSGFRDWGAGIGFDLGFDGQTYRTYDASAYAGITFWARGLPETVMQVRISTAVTTHAEWGGTCPQELCPFPYHSTLTLSSQWTQYWIPFADLYQVSWSTPANFQLNQLTNIQFFVPGLTQCEDWQWGCNDTQTFDFWVDDVAFYADPPPCCSALPACQGVIGFPDARLEQAVRTAINHPTGDLTCHDACAVYVLSADAGDLAGAECLANLGTLLVAGNWTKTISTLGPLASLGHLTTLQVAGTAVSDLAPLSGLTKLTTLDLGGNQISDLAPLSSLTNLTTLDLGGNQISDLGPLSTLTSLTDLRLLRNQVSDTAPLLGLLRLTLVDLRSNPVCLHPDATLTTLQQLGVLVCV